MNLDNVTLYFTCKDIAEYDILSQYERLYCCNMNCDNRIPNYCPKLKHLACNNTLFCHECHEHALKVSSQFIFFCTRFPITISCQMRNCNNKVTDIFSDNTRTLYQNGRFKCKECAQARRYAY